MRSDGRWPRLALYAAGLAAVAFSPGLAPLEAPWAKLDHHAMVYGRRLAVAILLGALLLSAGLATLARLPGNSARAWLIAYYVLQVASIEAIAIMGPGYIRPLNTAHAAIVAALFVAWATLGTRTAGTPGTERPR